MRRYSLFILFLVFNACSTGQAFNQQIANQAHKESIKKTKSTYQVIEVNRGDLACYVELLNLRTQKQATFPSSFDWCEAGRLQQGQTYIIDFEDIEIADCISIEPCETTIKVSSLKHVKLLSQ